MKTIKLLNLKLTNFKGIKSLEIDFNGNDTKVFGDNGTGKTTVFDAFVWLLFNKDSQNKTDFEIKTMENDKVIHNLNHEVEATLLVNESQLQLKKVYKEKWTKPKGKAEQVFGGHTTDYYINEVPSKKKEYDETIADIIDEDVFKLLTNPNEFNVNMHWKDRRNLLFEIAGDITDEDVIASDKDLSKLLDALNGRSVDDMKKVIAAKRKEINKKLEEIPTRIDELHRNKPDTGGISKLVVNAQLKDNTSQIEAKNNEIEKVKLGTTTNDLKRKVSDIELQIANVRNEHTQNEQEALFKLKAKLQEEQSNHQILQGDVRNLLQQKQEIERAIESTEKYLNDLRADFVNIKKAHDELKDKVFTATEEDCTCPTCKQDLPKEQIEEVEAEFNANKSKKLELYLEDMKDIDSKGKEKNKELQELKEQLEEVQKQIDKVTETGKKKVEDIERLKAQIEEVESKVTPLEENENYIALNEEKQALEKQIEEQEQSLDSSLKELVDEKNNLTEELNSVQKSLASFDEIERANKRIEELKDEEKKLAAAFEEQEHLLYLTEEFTRKKVELITDKVNSKFKYARFKLFNELINGGLEETCVVIGDNGESFDNINNAHRINVSLDIINTLSKHYGVQAPIFVDNAESVTKLIDIDAQVISLIVSEKDKELRVEAEKQNESVVA